MKRSLLLVAALTMVSASAFAQKAREAALQGAEHIKTTRSIFTNPADIMNMSDFATFEMGPSDQAGTPRAEGGFTRTMGAAKLGFHLGNNSRSQIAARTAAGAIGGGFLLPENSFEVTYGGGEAMKWGGSFIYSSSDMKSTEQKQSAMGVRLGATTEMWEASAQIGLGSTAKGAGARAAMDLNGDGDTADAGEAAVAGGATDKDADYKGTGGMSLAGAYIMDSTKIYLMYDMDGFKAENGAGTAKINATTTVTTLGFVNSMKNEGVDFYYGAAYVMMTEEEKEGSKKTDTSRLPFFIGVEAEAASWMTLRGSVKQNVLVGSTKPKGGKADTPANDTTTAAGAGFKFGKVNLDTVMGVGSTGALLEGGNANTFTNASLTYWF